MGRRKHHNKLPPRPFSRQAPKKPSPKQVIRAYGARMGFFKQGGTDVKKKLEAVKKRLKEGRGKLSEAQIENLRIMEHGLSILSLRRQIEFESELMGLKTFLRDRQIEKGAAKKVIQELTRKMNLQAEVKEALEAELEAVGTVFFSKKWKQIIKNLEELRARLDAEKQKPGSAETLKSKIGLLLEINRLWQDYEKIQQFFLRKRFEK